MRKIAIVGLMLLCSALTFGQGETSNWYFGQSAGIQFNDDGSVTALDDGRIRTFEGCATISDPLGNLLFYTDGITVYDRTHTVMENGRALYGDVSSTQSGIIVPDPVNPDLFYIFTVDTKVFQNDPDFGLNYSVVDMSLNNGNGAIVQKNINLLPDCSEKITAVVKDCADQSIWILTLATADGSTGLLDTYHAFELNASGVVTTSVQSTFSGLDIQDPRGYLKLSPDGTKLVSANATSGLYLYDFDAATGILSNQTLIEINGANKVSYGVEFSPDGELLYVHASNDQQGETGHASTLYQYDLTTTDISASEVVLDSGNTYRGALQLGANGKIYRTIANSYTVGTPYLGAINNPNVRGINADYQHQAVSLGSRNAMQGLPPFVQSFFNKTALIRNADGSTSNSLELCEGESFLLQTDEIPGALYEWERDGNPLSANTHLLQEEDIDSLDSGRYSVRITTPDPSECPIIGEAFIQVNPLPQAVELSMVQCDVDPGASEDGISVFNLEESIVDTSLEYRFYETESDRINDLPIENPTLYVNRDPFTQTVHYKVTNEFGCDDFGLLELEVRSNPFSIENDETLYSCDINTSDNLLVGNFDLASYSMDRYPDTDVSFYSSETDVNLKTDPLPANIESGSTVIFARLENDNICLGVDRIQLEVLPGPFFELDDSYLLCTDSPLLTVEAPLGFDFYRWSRLGGNSSVLSESSTLEITALGQYSLTAGYVYDFPETTFFCEYSKNFQVLPSNKATFTEIVIDDFTDDNSVQVLVSGDGDYEFSLDGLHYQSVDLFRDVAPGFYTVYVRDRNGCGISTKDISVLGYPKFFTPNGDGINDLWRITGTSEQFEADAFITIYDRFGKLLAQIDPLDEGWNGMWQSNPLPASDYWFRVKLSDGREITGHFALKR